MSAGCPLCGAAIVDDARVMFDIDSGILAVGTRIADLTRQEFALFETLWAARPRTLDKEALLGALYGLLPDADEPQIKIIDVYVHKLRRKVAPLGLRIETSWGRGYRILPPAANPFPADTPGTTGAQE